MANEPLGRHVVIGVGNPWRSDDGVGLVVARRVAERCPRIAVVEHEGDGAALLEVWATADAVTVVDAAVSDEPPGTVHRFDAHRVELPPAMFHRSTHAVGLADAVALGRAMGRLPRRLTIYGIVAASFEAGSGLSSPVARAVEPMVVQIAAEIDAPAERFQEPRRA